MKISWINDAGIRAETSQGLILFNHDESMLNESSQKDENTIAIFLDENLKKDSEKKLLESTVSIFEPGEYEINNIPIQGHAIRLNTENLDESVNIYSVYSEGMTICYLSEISKITIPANITESIGKIDILICLSDDSSDKSVESINSLLSSLDPKILIIVDGLKYRKKTLKTEFAGFIRAKSKSPVLMEWDSSQKLSLTSVI